MIAQNDAGEFLLEGVALSDLKIKKVFYRDIERFGNSATPFD